MKIIGGLLKGRVIRAPGGKIARPMRSQVREALFQRLTPLIPGARVLDVFAGSGSLGLEALSRGAERVVFCERAPVCLKTIARNLKDFGLLAKADIVNIDLARPLTPLFDYGPFKVVLMDPPFPLLRRPPGPKDADIRKVLQQLGQSELLTDDALIVFETPSRCFRVEPELADWGLDLELRREYGSTALWILSKLGAEAEAS